MTGPRGLAPETTICALVVTHHPEPSFPSRLEAVARECGAAVVVDNGSNASEIGMIEREATRQGAHLIRNPSNLGLAAALNQGARWAFAQGHAFILVLDQDSEPMPGIADELSSVYRLANAEQRTAIVGSNFIDKATRQPRIRNVQRTGSEWTPRRTVIMSGSLIEREAFEAVGPFREEFFVDSVDHDFCLRARRLGFQVAATVKPLMEHSLGAPTARRRLGITFVTSNHSADRRYLATRNRTALAREYALEEPRWVAASVYSLLKETLVVLLVEDERAAKVKSMLLGAWHGLRGRLGPIAVGVAR